MVVVNKMVTSKNNMTRILLSIGVVSVQKKA